MRRLLVRIVLGAALVALAWQLFVPARYDGMTWLAVRRLLDRREIVSPALRTVTDRLRAPEGFVLTRFAEDLSNARLLRFTATGDLLVSRPRAGEVTLLERDADGDGRADGRRTLLSHLDRPHGLDLHDGWLYVAENAAIGRIRFDAASRSVQGTFERIVTGLPAGGNHWTRTLRFGPDGSMYVTIGSSCNACRDDDPRRAAMLRFRADGSEPEIYASGLRNAVGFDWRPDTGELYATDNDRETLGDDFPPCELDRIERGGFYGFPFANGDRVADPDFGAGEEAKIAASIPPAHAFAAHSAPLGIAFVRGSNLPAELRDTALVALHGSSWRRGGKVGYEVVSLRWRPDGSIEQQPFLTGFLGANDDVIGRPVDVAEGPDGAIYVSDDYAGSIYRLVYASGGHDRVASEAASAREAPRDPFAGVSTAERAEAIGRGVALYASHRCAGCHEADRAIGDLPTIALRGLLRRWDVDALATFLHAPNPPMPPVELPDRERRDLAIWLLSTHG